MNRRGDYARRLPWLVVGSSVLLLCACRSTPDKPAPVPDEPWRIAQFGHGREARFMRCRLSACPTVTAKTLAVRARIAPAPREARVTFAFGTARLDATAQAVLDALVDDAAQARQIQLNGYTDSRGPTAVNLNLSRQRAEAVRDYLLRTHDRPALGIDLSGHGACCFVASNETAEGRAQNRRVDILIEPGSLP